MRRTVAALALLLLTAGAAWLAIDRLRPPDAVPESAPATEFSAERAMHHVRKLAVQPRPIGSEAHEVARSYIVGALRGLGLRTEQWSGVGAYVGRPVFGSVRDLIARVPGTGASPGTVLLMAHYDSVPAGPGASDDAVGVAVLLETLRALLAGPQPKNDVVALFTDGEETGLLGAEAFLHGHPLADKVDVVVNFEARGTRGPSLMFETGPGNLWAIGRFATAPYPVGASYSYEIYKRLPNDTDYTLFKRRKIPGLNFAHIHGAVAYHTALDSIRHLDTSTVQHHGSNALALAHAFGDADLEQAHHGGNAVYFNPLGSAFVYYPASWVLGLLALLGVLVVAVIALGVSRRRIGLGRTLLGVVLGIVVLVVLGGVFLVLRGLLFPLRYDFWIWGTGSSVAWTELGATLLALGAAIALLRLAGRFGRPGDATAAGLVLWLVVTAAVSVVAPGASYLFMVPLLFQILAVGALFLRAGASDEQEDAPMGVLPLALLVLAAVVTALVWAPTLSLIAVGLQAPGVLVLVVLSALLLAFLAPQVEVLSGTRPRWAVPVLLVVAGLAVIVAVRSASAFGPENPRPTNLIYVLDADRGEAVWASLKPKPDEWTGKVLPETPEMRALPEFLGRDGKLATGPAPVLPLAEPSLQLLGSDAGVTHLRVVPPAGAARVRILLSPRSAVEGVSIAGREAELAGADASDAPYVLTYFAPPTEGVDLDVTTADPKALQVAVAGQWWGVPTADQGGPGPKPEGYMQAPWPFDADTTLVRRAWSVGDLSDAGDLAPPSDSAEGMADDGAGDASDAGASDGASAG